LPAARAATRCPLAQKKLSVHSSLPRKHPMF